MAISWNLATSHIKCVYLISRSSKEELSPNVDSGREASDLMAKAHQNVTNM